MSNSILKVNTYWKFKAYNAQLILLTIFPLFIVTTMQQHSSSYLWNFPQTPKKFLGHFQEKTSIEVLLGQEISHKDLWLMTRNNLEPRGSSYSHTAVIRGNTVPSLSGRWNEQGWIFSVMAPRLCCRGRFGFFVECVSHATSTHIFWAACWYFCFVICVLHFRLIVLMLPVGYSEGQIWVEQHDIQFWKWNKKADKYLNPNDAKKEAKTECCFSTLI